MKIEDACAIATLKLLMGPQGPSMFEATYEALSRAYHTGWGEGWDSGVQYGAEVEPSAETIAAAEFNLYGER